MMRAAAFMALAMTDPRAVGAVVPSSRHLAAAMARAADGAGRLLELGAGTGAITAALRERHPQLPMLAVERHGALAAQLRERFPDIEVRAAAAHEVLRRWRHDDGVTLVSSLPFRSLPAPLRRRSQHAIERFLDGRPQHRLVQYTYLPRAPFELSAGARLRWRCIGAVWLNVPPAWVWELRAEG